MQKLRLAVIGTGHLGKNHLRIFSEMTEIELVAFSDISEELVDEYSEKYGVKGYTDFEKLLGENLDGVSVVVPTEFHFKVASFFIKNGIHVMVEKPVTKTAAEAEELLALSQKHDVIFQVGHIERFNSAILSLKNAIQAPRYIESLRLGPFTPRVKDVGVVLDIMIHDIDIVLSLVNSPVERIDAVGVSVVSAHEDIANAHIVFKNGTIANFSASRLSNEKCRKIRIFNNDAYFSVDYADQEVKIQKLQNGGIVEEKPEIQKEEPLKLELQDFIKCIQEKRKPVVSGLEGSQALKVAMDIINKIKEREKLFNSDDNSK
ncbi:Gfo/Idh/MocA family oxidoreductase [bacterium]|nr:Gfo/Idh/MocA family oxidoreductase [bacterium]